MGAALAEIARVALPGARREEPELNKELGEKAAERPGGAAPQPPSGAPSDSRANIPPRCFLPARETLLPLSWSPGGPARRPGPARRGAAQRNREQGETPTPEPAHNLLETLEQQGQEEFRLWSGGGARSSA